MMDLVGRQCVAVAYAWRFAATVFEEFHILLTVSSLRGVFSDSTPESSWNQWFATERRSTTSYRIRFPQASDYKDDFNVSGVAGLLGPERTRTSRGAERFSAAKYSFRNSSS